MEIEVHIYNAKTALDFANQMIETQDYDTALDLLASAYSNVRWLIEHVWELKRDTDLSDSNVDDIQRKGEK